MKSEIADNRCQKRLNRAFPRDFRLSVAAHLRGLQPSRVEWSKILVFRGFATTQGVIAAIRNRI
jgi:hypothetical protein